MAVPLSITALLNRFIDKGDNRCILTETAPFNYNHKKNSIYYLIISLRFKSLKSYFIFL